MKGKLPLFLAVLLAASACFAQVVPFTSPAPTPTSTIIGQIQTATGGVIPYGTMTFLLSQPGVVVGTASLVSQAVSCYTSAQGNISGLPDPLTLPVLSTNIISGTLPAATYYVEIYYYDAASHVSAVSPEANVILTSTGSVLVNAPILQPANAVGYGVAIATASGQETVQSQITGFPQYTQSVPLVTGSTPGTVNTSFCNLYFSDELIPTGTYYSVNLLNKNGSQVAGFPQSWCTYGGAGATINVSQGVPTGNCNVNGVFYPTPIFANAAASQSIASPIAFPGGVFGNTTFSGNNTFTGGNIFQGLETFSGSLIATNANGVLNASQFSGSDIFAKANAAAASLAGAPGVVVIPPGIYTGVQTTLLGVKGVLFFGYGAIVNFSGTSGSAMQFSSVSNSGVVGLTLYGPATGTSVGLYVGSSAASTGQTIYNLFSDLQIGGNDATGLVSGFNHGVQCDGTTGAGTYTNTFRNVNVYASLGAQWYLSPTTPQYCNANNFTGDYAQHGAADGIYLNGAYGNTFTGFRAETNAGWGVNLGATATTNNNQFYGGWFESNTSGDFTCGANVSNTQVYGSNSASSGGVASGCLNGTATVAGNVFLVTNTTVNQTAQWYGWNHTYTVNSNTPASETIFQFFNAETPGSGITDVFGWFRTSSNHGSINIGSPEYPATLQSHLNQTASKTFAGGCSMSGTTSCTFSIANSYTSAPLCFASVQVASPTTFQGSCALSGTTVTITASASNSNAWGALLIGNPN